jgi:anti-anti-sigma factor
MSTEWERINERFVGEVAILDVSGGHISLGEPPRRVLEAIRQLVSRRYRNVLLNLREVQYIDSEGLAEIVECYKTVRGAGGALKLCAAKRIQDLLVRVKLDRVIDTFDSESVALSSFAAQV